MQKMILLSLTILFLMASCKKESDEDQLSTEEETTQVEEIIFGNVYGFCVSPCRRLYRLDAEALYKDLDTDSTTPYEDTPFSTTALATEKYELAKSLLTIPAGLLSSTQDIEKQIISDMDFYLRVETATGDKVWIWDDISEDANSEWRGYFDQLEEIVLELRR